MSHVWKEPDVPVSDEDLWGDEKKTQEVSEPLVVFRLAGEWFALPSAQIQEVVGVKGITYLPGVSPCVSGVVNIRGAIVPVVEPKQILGLPSTPPTRDARIIVVHSGNDHWALLADEVAELVSIALGVLEPPPLTLEAEKLKIVQNTFYWKSHLIALLRVESMRGYLH